MPNRAEIKRSRIASLIGSGTLYDAAFHGDLFERADNTKLWPHDIIGIADLLELRSASLAAIVGAKAYTRIIHSLRQAEAKFIQVDESLCKFSRRREVQETMGSSVVSLGMVDLPVGVFPGPVWGVLAEVALLLNSLKLYSHFRGRSFRVEREKARALVDEADITVRSWQAAVRTVSEVGDSDLFEELLLRSPAAASAKDKLVSASAHLQLGNLKEYRRRIQPHFTPRDREFARFIKGKSIAISGPVDVGLESGSEIDSFDLVLRYNFQGKAASQTKFGSRTDLSFYIDIDLPRNKGLDEIKRAALNSLQYAVVDFTHADTDACFDGVTVPKRQRLKAGHIFCNQFFKGTHNAIPRSIADLLRFDIKKIKVFNADMFASLNYQPDYRESTGEMLLKTFVRHDPISNFSFMKDLWRAGSIQVDQRLGEVLSLSPEQYLEVLDRQYGAKDLVDVPDARFLSSEELKDRPVAAPLARIWPSLFRGRRDTR
jgi:hypothetical protein